jgi:hypothetical protein
MPDGVLDQRLQRDRRQGNRRQRIGQIENDFDAGKPALSCSFNPSWICRQTGFADSKRCAV